MTSDLATSAKSDVSVARWVAMIAGLLGFVMAVATPLLPVTQTTATLSWPQQGQVGNVTAPLISQAPVDLRATVPCEVIDSMPGDGGLVLGTAPEQGRDAALNAMLVMVSESRVDVIVRNVVVASVDRDRMGGCSELVITSSLDGTYAEFTGLTQEDGSPQRTGYPDPNLRPAIVGVFTDLSGPAPPGLSLSATIDTRFTSQPTTLKLVAILLAITSTVIALLALWRLDRLDGEARRLAEARTALSEEGDPEVLLQDAAQARAAAETALTGARDALEQKRAAKEQLQAARDEASSALSSARAELAGIEREWQALKRDREARERQAQGALPKALDKVRAEKGYERALAAALGRDAKAMLGNADGDGRYWTGASKPEPVADSLAAHVTDCPPELSARLALVHVVDTDDGRALKPGEWLVTRDGALRRWDGFVARGEGGAEAARLEAENRFAELDAQLPALRNAVETADKHHDEAQEDLRTLQTDLVAAERAVNDAVEDERAALREVDRAEALKARLASRAEELSRAEGELAEQRKQAELDLDHARGKKAELPDPASGRATLSAAQAKQDAARAAQQSALTALSSHEQSLAVARERAERQKADIAGWQARSDDATRRLSDMSRRFEEIEEERAVVAAKPEGLIKEIEQGDVVRARLTAELEAAEQAVTEAGETARAADEELREVQEALSTAREGRAAASTRAENEDARRKEMAGVAGERFQVPPPMLPGKFEFDEDAVKSAGEESTEMDRLVASRDRLGPVNLVAKTELEEAEEKHGASIAEQEELGEAVNRLRGSIGNLNREGRERLRAAFHAVDAHFQRLFARLFEGGEAHLALIDSDDPLEAGLEIYAQPPGKRLQSLTLLSGGEQALTAIALIFALFLTNPAPICVLDEVDAPLDDANIDRFCDLLDAMVRETATRYLIVTHNAVTMSRMHRLFGVTMVEKGVSRLVSVDLGGAEELLAAE